MLLRIDQITLRRRVRKDLGDLSALMESMRIHGLMAPILVNKDKELIAGERRLESAKRLGWKTVEAYIVDKEDELERLEMEVDENLQRKELTAGELTNAYSRIDRLKHPPLLLRLWRAFVALIRRLFGRE